MRRRVAYAGDGDKQGEGVLLRVGSYQFLHAAGFVASLDESSPARRTIHDGRAGDEAIRKQSPDQNLGIGWVSRGGRPWLGGRASGGTATDDSAPSLVGGRDVKAWMWWEQRRHRPRIGLRAKRENRSKLPKRDLD